MEAECTSFKLSMVTIRWELGVRWTFHSLFCVDTHMLASKRDNTGRFFILADGLMNDDELSFQ